LQLSRVFSFFYLHFHFFKCQVGCSSCHTSHRLFPLCITRRRRAIRTMTIKKGEASAEPTTIREAWLGEQDSRFPAKG
jgi:hypothetical protein